MEERRGNKEVRRSTSQSSHRLSFNWPHTLRGKTLPHSQLITFGGSLADVHCHYDIYNVRVQSMCSIDAREEIPQSANAPSPRTRQNASLPNSADMTSRKCSRFFIPQSDKRQGLPRNSSLMLIFHTH